LQFAYPNSDIENPGGWSVEPLWEKLDEEPFDDGDFITSPKSAAGASFTIGLSALIDPEVHADHVIRIRAKTGVSGTFKYELLQGIVVIIDSGDVVLGTVETEYNMLLPEEVAANISDYSALRLRVTAISTQKNQRQNVSWIRIDVPDAPGEEHSGSGSISGNGSCAGTTKKGGLGSALKSAGGTLLAIGLAGMLGIASIVGEDSQLAVGKKSVSTSASVSGGGSIVVTGAVVESHSGVAIVTGGGMLIALGTKSAEGSGEVSEGGIVGARAGEGVASTTWLWGWDFRKKITVKDDHVDSDLTNFPLYVPIKADADFHHARADGYDIRFTLSDGKTLMKYEREHWNGGNGNPATAHFWVKIPSILASGGAIIYVDYGKSDAPDGEDAPNVWDANFKAVWHMKDITPSTIADSTGILNGTKKAANEPIEAEGKVYKGQEFGGEVSRDYILTANSILLPGTCTYESWFKVNNFTSWAAVVSNLKHDTPASGFNIIPYHSSGYFKICAGNGVDYYVYKIFYPVPRLITGVLYHVAVTHDGTKFRLYINNVFQGEWIQALGQINQKFLMGRWAISYTSQYFLDSLVDEVRVSNIVRLPAWRKFGYHNINEADNELTWGSEEMVVSKYSSSKRTNSAIVKEVRPAGMKEVRFAGAREVRTPHVKTTRPSVGTFTRKG